MDERALSWTHLLPADTTFRLWNAPEALRGLLDGRCAESGDAWLGWGAARRDLPATDRLRALALVNPRGVSLADLRAAGFGLAQAFAVLPRLDDARWFIPLHPRRGALGGWDLYTPFRRGARLHKIAARLMAGSGALGRVGDRVLLARRAASPLEETLMRAVDAPYLSVAIAAGKTGPRRRMMLRLAAPDGTALAYAKYADRPAGAALVRHEARFLERAAELGLRHAVVPRLIHHGAHGDGYVTVAAPVTREPAAARIGMTPRHIAALRELAGHRGALATGDLLAQLRERVEALRESIAPEWHARLARGAAAASAQGLDALPATFAHGDFAPWNLCVDRASDRLAIVDWESGETDQLPLWDSLHFQTQVEVLVRRRTPAASRVAVLAATLALPLARDLGLSAAQVAALYLAYLVDASARWFEARLPPQSRLLIDDAAQVARGEMIDLFNVPAFDDRR